jgi:hypothetical protein
MCFHSRHGATLFGIYFATLEIQVFSVSVIILPGQAEYLSSLLVIFAAKLREILAGENRVKAGCLHPSLV